MADLIRTYHAFLTQAGFRPYVENDEDISFRFEGGSFVMRVLADDPSLFQLILPDVGGAGGGVAEAANSVNASVKGVKLTYGGEKTAVRAVVQTMLPFRDGLTDIEQFECVLMRSLGALQYARQRFSDALQATR